MMLDSDWRDEPDRPHEACGVFGVYAPTLDVAKLTFFGLYALQHRGQESAGIAVSDGTTVRWHKHVGLVAQVFTEDILAQMPGHIAMGHTRYSTTGSNRVNNAHPVVEMCDLGRFALGHNGNLTNTLSLHDRLRRMGVKTSGSTDTELIALLVANTPGATFVERLQAVLPLIEGAYSLVMLTPQSVIGIRDPHGVRPLSVGRLGDAWVLASETCALETVGATPEREVRPGEIVEIAGVGEAGLRSHVGVPSQRQAGCLFEYIYFSRPDSTLRGRSLYLARQRMGERLAREFPVPADVVIGVPDSATPAAAGYAAARGMPYMDGLIKNRYIGRTFIQPDQHMRAVGVKMKFNALGAVLTGKRVVMIDDSIVRGTTVRPLVKLLRDAGAREVHLGITSPPFRFPCYLGLDVAKRSELIAARTDSAAEIAREVGADSVHYLSLDGLIEAIDLPADGFCVGCFTGRYPVPVDTADGDKFALEPELAAKR